MILFVAHHATNSSLFPSFPATLAPSPDIFQSAKPVRNQGFPSGKESPPVTPPSAFKAYNPKFEGQQPLQLIAAMRELAEELKNRGFSYKGELTYLNVIKI
ncbi:hypothetical protein [uncultured Duncaniella sp.]|uniref:hypothetical protein n=1 Tax=uncultured Duncaniella sp. TaxID=2768039 RepID=UPI0025A94178|nr:hypothetical protein [uncultured Duncaniella sp.]